MDSFSKFAAFVRSLPSVQQIRLLPATVSTTQPTLPIAPPVTRGRMVAAFDRALTRKGFERRMFGDTPQYRAYGSPWMPVQQATLIASKLA